MIKKFTNHHHHAPDTSDTYPDIPLPLTTHVPTQQEKGAFKVLSLLA